MSRTAPACRRQPKSLTRSLAAFHPPSNIQGTPNPLLHKAFARSDRLNHPSASCRLGLLAHDHPLRVANPIYAEAIPREFTAADQADLPLQSAWYIDSDRASMIGELQAGFQDFFRQRTEHWLKRFHYQETTPQLPPRAYLQRVLKSSRHIDRKYGLGSGRTGLLVTRPHAKGA